MKNEKYKTLAEGLNPPPPDNRPKPPPPPPSFAFNPLKLQQNFNKK